LRTSSSSAEPENSRLPAFQRHCVALSLSRRRARGHPKDRRDHQPLPRGFTERIGRAGVAAQMTKETETTFKPQTVHRTGSTSIPQSILRHMIRNEGSALAQGPRWARGGVLERLQFEFCVQLRPN
jgi:hypothetical protein